MAISTLKLTFGERFQNFLSTKNDYKKLRTTLQRRIHNLKKQLSIQSNGKNYKQIKFSSQDYSQDDRYFLITLFTVEKNLLYTLESSENTTLVKTRLKRSLTLIDQLINSIDFDDVEVLVYRELIKGIYSIVTKKWNDAIVAYSNARVSLEYLDSKITDNTTLYKTIIEEIIDENLKLAIYRSLKTTVDLNQFSRVKFDKNSKLYRYINDESVDFFVNDETNLIKRIEWRSYNADITNFTTSKLLSQAKTINVSNVEDLNTVLSHYQDALSNHQSQISSKQENVNNNDEDDDDYDNQEDEILLSYIKLQSLITRIKRDDLLMNESLHGGKIDKVFKLIEFIKLTIDEVLETPGVYSDDELYQQFNSLLKYYDSIKLNQISTFYYNQEKFISSFKISSKALENLTNLNISIISHDLNIDQDIIDKLYQSVKSLKVNSFILIQIESKISKDVSTSDDISKQSLNLHKIVELGIDSIPIKPVLFDVAFNYVSYTKNGGIPKQSHTLKEITKDEEGDNTNEESSSEQKKRGFFGLFR